MLKYLVLINLKQRNNNFMGFFSKKNKTVSTECQTEPEDLGICIIKGKYYKNETIDLHEDMYTEFKASMNGTFIVKDLISFANTRGGTIFYGITDARVICGIHITDLDCIQQKLILQINQSIFPRITHYTIKFYQVAHNCYIIALKIMKSDTEHSNSDGVIFHRCGSSSVTKSNPLEGVIADLQKKIQYEAKQKGEYQSKLAKLEALVKIQETKLNAIKKMLLN